MRCCILAVLLLGSSCAPNTLDGVVNGEELSGFQSSVYVETRGVDPTSFVDLHPITLWLLPVDGCATFEVLVNEAASLRAQLDAGMDPTTYCDAWELMVVDAIGSEAFWIARFRLQAQPRRDVETPEREYPFFDEQSGLPSEPYWDGELLRFAPATFDACAEEFAGAARYAATTAGGTGGTVTVSTWEADARLKGTLAPDFDGAEGALSGRFDADHCIDAGQWPVDFLGSPGTD